MDGLISFLTTFIIVFDAVISEDFSHVVNHYLVLDRLRVVTELKEVINYLLINIDLFLHALSKFQTLHQVLDGFFPVLDACEITGNKFYRL